MPSESPALPFAVDVQCYAGYRAEETPRCFQMAGEVIAIEEVIDRWLAPSHRYFKVRDARGHVYILRHDVTQQRWELTFFRCAATAAAL